MNEDDTFNALRRRPLKQVHDEFVADDTMYGTVALYIHLTKNNWTLKEFVSYQFESLQRESPQEDVDDWVETYYTHCLEDLKDAGIEVDRE